MIVGIGIDISNITRMSELYKKFGDKILNKILSDDEILEFKNNKKPIANFLAKRFCAKEAFTKALGLGLGRGIELKDISYIHDKLGKPIIKLNKKADSIVKKTILKNDYSIHVSSTDEGELINCLVIIEI
jgi:holo-[acyl-carrier protein] synthase